MPKIMAWHTYPVWPLDQLYFKYINIYSYFKVLYSNFVKFLFKSVLNFASTVQKTSAVLTLAKTVHQEKRHFGCEICVSIELYWLE